VDKNTRINALGIPNLIGLSSKRGARQMDEIPTEKYFGHMEFETGSSKGVNNKNIDPKNENETNFETKDFIFMDDIYRPGSKIFINS
jgi:hypothetical protein